MREQVLPSVRLAVVSFVLCGLVYPLAVTAVAKVVLPFQANGSLLPGAPGQPPVGALPIGQKFDGPGWFQGRPSAVDYKAESAGASNLGPTSQALADRLATDVKRLRAANPDAGAGTLPVDLATASGSGLDPDITPAAAYWQVPRVAKARGLAAERVRALVESQITPRDWGLFGEPRVNVLKLDLALASLRP